MLTFRRALSGLSRPIKAASSSSRAASVLALEDQPNDAKVRIDQVASQQATAIALRDLFMYGRQRDPKSVVAHANFMRRELPVRFAHRVMELNALPHGLAKSPQIDLVRQAYMKIVGDLLDEPRLTTPGEALVFAERLERMMVFKNECQTVQTMALGVLNLRRELRRKGRWTHETRRETDRELDRFYMSRIGLRFITEQFLAASKQVQSGEVEVPPDNDAEALSGIIDGACSPVRVASFAADHARSLCTHHMQVAPSIVVKGDPSATFTYVPEHLYYILLELLKNACRATVEMRAPRDDETGEVRGYDLDEDDLPPITVVVVHGDEDVTIKVADEGGGIPRSEWPLLWTYMHSTAPRPESDAASGGASGGCAVDSMALHEALTSPHGSRGGGGGDGGGAGVHGAPGALAGYGVGLPMSRLYARYFGGDVDIKSMEGFGTDCFVHIHRLGHKCESLPEAVAHSPGEKRSDIEEMKQQQRQEVVE